MTKYRNKNTGTVYATCEIDDDYAWVTTTTGKTPYLVKVENLEQV